MNNVGATGSSMYSIPNAELLLSLDLSRVEFPRENLRFFGEYQYLTPYFSINIIISSRIALSNTITATELINDTMMMRNNVNNSLSLSDDWLLLGEAIKYFLCKLLFSDSGAAYDAR
ncbi:hypothetical protein DPMN_070388 [Dreissena polymorpha]|uniref:Uncharacterized protein n=1 Tax=Dreissena polymorpha TaxID=45954 RepID=A0A9D3Z5V3_DREPO|nr:hypothetical protein DPMN_070388 [Dreissena polymorpha]